MSLSPVAVEAVSRLYLYCTSKQRGLSIGQTAKVPVPRQESILAVLHYGIGSKPRKGTHMAETDEARKAILEQIVKAAQAGSTRSALELAEAWAWLSSPYQGHGSPAAPKSM
jgi:hypothetical protein